MLSNVWIRGNSLSSHEIILLDTCIKEHKKYSTNVLFHPFKERILKYSEHAKSVLWVIVHVHTTSWNPYICIIHDRLCRILNNFSHICSFSICKTFMCTISCNSSQGPWETHGTTLKHLISNIPKDRLKGVNSIDIKQEPKKWSRSALMTYRWNTHHLVASKTKFYNRAAIVLASPPPLVLNFWCFDCRNTSLVLEDYKKMIRKNRCALASYTG